MTFDIQDYYRFSTLLREHPEFREEMRRMLLSDEILTLPELVRGLSVSVQELIEAQKRTDERLDQLSAAIAELTAAQKRTDERLAELTAAQKRTDERLAELAAAQKRTDERLAELAAAQKRTDERLEELTAAQKRTDERLDRLSATVETLAVAQQELAAAQKRTDERLAELTAAQKRTDERLDRLSATVETLAVAQQELAAAQKRTDERLAELAATQKRTDESVRQLSVTVQQLAGELKDTRRKVESLSGLIGTSLEEEAASVLEAVMREKGYRLLTKAMPLRWNGEVDVILSIADPQGRQMTVVVESKLRLSRKHVIAWASRTKSKGWRKHLIERGYPEPYLVYVYGMRADKSAVDAVRETGMGLMKAEGEIIAPQEWIE